MKVNVNMKVASSKNAGDNTSFQFKVNSEDLVEKVKERIAAAQLVAFPEQDLLIDGTVMDDKKTMSDYDVKESASLDFVVKATEEMLMKQVAELLQARDLTCDELGLLYCYKHGVSLNQALKTVGVQDKFQERYSDVAFDPVKIEDLGVTMEEECQIRVQRVPMNMERGGWKQSHDIDV